MNKVIAKVTNETLGITTEYAFCKVYNIKNNINEKRVSQYLCDQITPKIELFKEKYPELKINQHCGGDNGSVDFKTVNDETISLKTNKSKSGPKMCPQNIGQPTRKKFIEYNNISNNIDDDNLKKYIIENINELSKKYYNNLFCCDHLIWFYKKTDTEFDFKVLKKVNYPFDDNNFTFSRYVNDEDIKNTKSKKKWNEGSTLYYNKKSIGEFQFHKNRDCIKFRYYIKKLLDFI